MSDVIYSSNNVGCGCSHAQSPIIITKREGIQGPQGQDGRDGVTPYISETNFHWIIGTVDTGILAVGKDGQTPYIGENGNWWIGETDTGYAVTFVPTIDSTTFNWKINGTDTGVCAKGQDGHTPYIGPNGNWWINGVDTGVHSGSKILTFSTYERLPGKTLNPLLQGNENNLYVVVDMGYKLFKYNNNDYYEVNDWASLTANDISNIIRAITNNKTSTIQYQNIYQAMVNNFTEKSEQFKTLYQAMLNDVTEGTEYYRTIFQCMLRDYSTGTEEIKNIFQAIGKDHTKNYQDIFQVLTGNLDDAKTMPYQTIMDALDGENYPHTVLMRLENYTLNGGDAN